MFSTERSLRVWLDPDKLIGYGLTTEDVTRAIQAQNAQVASGAIGDEPSRESQPVLAMILVKGQFASPEEFGAILLRSNPDGSTVRLRDVARVDVAGMTLSIYHATERETYCGLIRLPVADRQRAGDRKRRQCENGGTGEVLSAQYKVCNSL